jgi:hypothetical protein
MATRSRLAIFALLCVLSTPLSALADDTVLHWNEIAVNAAIANGQNPFVQARTGAMVSLAVFEAVNTITQDYQPYLGTLTAATGASVDAAAAGAAYRVLMNFFGGNAATVALLDAELEATLADIVDGQAAGLAVGDAAGWAIWTSRGNDGSANALVKIPGAAAIGEWQPTLPTCPLVNGVRVGTNLHWGAVAPFGVLDVTAFRPPAPPAVSSSQYAKDFAEVASVGLINSVTRPADRSDVARLYALSSPTYIFDMAARQVAVTLGASLSANARSLALLNMAISDALVASFNAKYHYNFWRPETAIAGAGTDGNSRTVANTDYHPYINTPCFPSYPSNHASGSGAGAEMLRRLYGAEGHSIDISNPAVAGVELHYTEFRQIINDVDDARVYGGIHFRFDQDAGDTLGRDISANVIKNNLRPGRNLRRGRGPRFPTS